MSSLFLSGGVMMWFILAVGAGVAWSAVRTGLRMKAADAPAAEGEVTRGLHAILFWGAMAVLLGFLGTAVGLVVMTQSIALAGSVNARLVWGGVGVTLVTLIFGLLVFLFSATVWFALRQWHGRQLSSG